MNIILQNKINIILNYFKANNYLRTISEIEILQKTNSNDFLLNLKGLSFHHLGKYEKALDCFHKAIKLNNNNLASKNNRGNSYKSLGKFDLAEDCYKDILAKNPNYIKSLVNLGNLKTQTFYFDEAINYYELYLKKDKNTAEVYRNLGVCFQSIGEIDKAKRIFFKALEIDKTFTEVDSLLSALINYSKDKDDHLKIMLSKLKTLELNKSKLINLYFAIAKAFDDKKNYIESYKYLKLGNDERKVLNTNNDFDIKNVIKSIKSHFTKFNYIKNDNKTKKVIFVLGLPRSGTTLVEKIISGHNKVSGIGELNFLPRIINEFAFHENNIDKFKIADFMKENIEKKYQENLKFYKIKNEIVIDKTLTNFIYIGFIKYFFPNSKIIHCSRDAKNNCLSIYKNLFSDAQSWCYNEEDIVDYYKSYKDIMNFWNDELGDEIYNIKYENLVQNFNEETKKLIKFCGLDWDKNCLTYYENDTPINTLSVNQANKPIYTTSLNASKNYENSLKNLFSKLA
tara:strand:+ start:1793 stop:3325 length:1533 start_codon:yes stop_codon:yes gene_type:complete